MEFKDSLFQESASETAFPMGKQPNKTDPDQINLALPRSQITKQVAYSPGNSTKCNQVNLFFIQSQTVVAESFG